MNNWRQKTTDGQMLRCHKIDNEHKNQTEIHDSLKIGTGPSSYYDRRLCLKNVPTSMTKPQVMKLVEDFENVTVYMP
jgi:hypothetical protein